MEKNPVDLPEDQISEGSASPAFSRSLPCPHGVLKALNRYVTGPHVRL